MSKVELYASLVELGYDCDYDPRYTKSMLSQIYMYLREKESIIIEQALTINDLQKKITNQNDELSLSKSRYENILKQAIEKGKELKEIKVCHDKCHKDNKKLLDKQENFNSFIKQLKEENRETQRELKKIKKKKIDNRPPPPYFIS